MKIVPVRPGDERITELLDKAVDEGGATMTTVLRGALAEAAREIAGEHERELDVLDALVRRAVRERRDPGLLRLVIEDLEAARRRK